MEQSIWQDESRGYCDFHENLILAYGMPKIGKSTFASQFPGALFIATEDGQKHIKCRRARVRSWLEFCDTVERICSQASKTPLQTIIIDTIDNLCDQCDAFVCEKQKVATLGDVPYGRGFAEYTREFKKQINKLLKLGLGMVFISHAEEKEVTADSIINPYAPMIADVETGKLTMTVPTMEKRARKFILGLVDIILYMEINGEGMRVIHCQPSKYFEAGDRSGRLPNTVELSYKSLVESYYGDNKSELVATIKKALKYVEDNGVDGLDAMSVYGIDTLEVASVAQLESYLQHIRMRCKSVKQEKKGAA